MSAALVDDREEAGQCLMGHLEVAGMIRGKTVLGRRDLLERRHAGVRIVRPVCLKLFRRLQSVEGAGYAVAEVEVELPQRFGQSDADPGLCLADVGRSQSRSQLVTVCMRAERL